jgi:hypothetical protein
MDPTHASQLPHKPARPLPFRLATPQMQVLPETILNSGDVRLFFRADRKLPIIFCTVRLVKRLYTETSPLL